eukprot:c19781_g1_i2 orf=493-1284(-)
MASVSAPYLRYGKQLQELYQRRSASACCQLSSSNSTTRRSIPSSLSLSNATRGRSIGRPLTASPMVPLVGIRISRVEAISSAITVSALPVEWDSSAITVGAAIATLLGFGSFRAFVYFRMQYIIAAMLGKYVPRGGSRVLDMDIHEGRNLYYYPSDIGEVVAVTDEKNREVVKNQAIRAGVPVDVKLKPLNSSSLPSNSMDAVVSVYCLCDLKEKDTRTFLREAIRLLKPGKRGSCGHVKYSQRKYCSCLVFRVLLRKTYLRC